MKLVKFLMRLKNETVTVELKNGTTVAGTIADVDSKMNTHIRLARVTLKDRPPVNLENFSIRGSQVRHIVLPEYLPIDILLEDEGPKRVVVKKRETPKKKIKKQKRGRKGSD